MGVTVDPGDHLARRGGIDTGATAAEVGMPLPALRLSAPDSPNSRSLPSAADELVVTGVAVDDVVAGGAEEDVVAARAAHRRPHPVPPSTRLSSDVSDEPVAVARPDDVLEPGDVVCSLAGGRLPRR